MNFPRCNTSTKIVLWDSRINCSTRLLLDLIPHKSVLGTSLHKFRWTSTNQKISVKGGIFDMLLYTPKDKAINNIRLAMSSLFHANKVLLAQRLVNKLKGSVCDVSARDFYPSWCTRVYPYQVMTRGISERVLLRSAVRKLWHACLDFEAAGMPRAAYVCLEFSSAILEELLAFSCSLADPVENILARDSERQ